MERSRLAPAVFRTQEYLSRPRKVLGWLGRHALRPGGREVGSVSRNGNGDDPTKAKSATTSESQSSFDDTLEFDVPDWRTASGVTVSALAMLTIESPGRAPLLTDAQKRDRQEDIDVAIAAGDAQQPASGQLPELFESAPHE